MLHINEYSIILKWFDQTHSIYYNVFSATYMYDVYWYLYYQYILYILSYIYNVRICIHRFWDFAVAAVANHLRFMITYWVQEIFVWTLPRQERTMRRSGGDLVNPWRWYAISNFISMIHRQNSTWDILSPGPINGHATGSDLLEVPTIYKAYVREYPHKIWPNIWH